MIELLAVAAVFLAADQWSKRLVWTHVAHTPLRCRPVVRIRRVITRKQMYERSTARAALVLLWLIAAACALALYGLRTEFQRQAVAWGLGAALGGAAGNLVDILRRRFVIDFIDVRWWPVFNLADVGIVGGLALVFWPYV